MIKICIVHLMNNKLIIFKKLLYRAGYRGTKEMDILLSSFVNKYINTFDEKLLKELEKFLNFEDEIILNYYHKNIVEKKLTKTVYQKFLKGLNLNGGEGGIRTHERVAPLLVFKTSARRSATSP